MTSALLLVCGILVGITLVLAVAWLAALIHWIGARHG